MSDQQQQGNPFDGKPFALSLVDNTVTFTIDGVGYGWGGPIADSDVGCRIAFRVPGAAPGEQLTSGIAVTDEIEQRLGEFFVANGLDWQSEKVSIDAIRAQKPLVIVHEDPAPRTDGPTLEEYVAAGYDAATYPPKGYAPVESKPPAPVVEIPPGHTVADAPAGVMAALPPGTIVSHGEEGEVTASVPHEGTVHHIIAGIGAKWHELVAKVDAYFASL